MKSWLQKNKWLVTVSVIILLGSYFIFGRKPKVEYDSYQVNVQSIQDTLELSGEVMAGTSATLRFPAGGLLTYLGAKEGDTVNKWQTIAKIDTRQLQKILEQKLNTYAIQRGTFEQTVDDNNNSIPDGDVGRTLQRLLAKNQYQLDTTVKDVEYQDLAIKLAVITSPVKGILVKSPVNVTGINVLTTDTWTIVDPTSLYFSADLDETDLKRVTVGQKVIVKLDAYPDLSIDTTITSIAYSPIETSTGTTYQVKIGLPAEDMSKFRLGLNGTAAVILSEKPNVTVLPASAVGNKNGNSYVYIKDGKVYKERSIKTGIENNGMVEVASGVQNGETVYQVK